MKLCRVGFRMLKVGSCRHYAWAAARGAGWAQTAFPSLCALIQHPTRGWMLYDTGYAPHFLQATERFPERLYRTLLPVTLPVEECLLTQLQRFGIGPADISNLLISHFHGDHVAGLRDFPQARFLALRADTEHAAAQGRLGGLLEGFLPELLPQDFATRLDYVDDAARVELPEWMRPFRSGFDLFGDRSLLAVPLPGHSHGQMGLVFEDQSGRMRFLVADACWSLPACREGREPSALTHLLFADRHRYRETFHGLRSLDSREPALSLLPSHCASTWAALEQEHA